MTTASGQTSSNSSCFEIARSRWRGTFEVVVAGDTASSTVFVTAQWSAQDPGNEQRAIECRTSGRLERELEKNIRSRAEKEAKKD